MRTIKVINGDFVIENGEFVMVEGDKEVSQGISMLLKIRGNEFELDENIGLKRDNILTKQFDEEEAQMDVIVALQTLTDAEIINEIDDVTFEKSDERRTMNISLHATTPNGSIEVKGVDV